MDAEEKKNQNAEEKKDWHCPYHFETCDDGEECVAAGCEYAKLEIDITIFPEGRNYTRWYCSLNDPR